MDNLINFVIRVNSVHTTFTYLMKTYEVCLLLVSICLEVNVMKRIAVIGAILEDPKESNVRFNETIAEYKGIIRGRMGIPFSEAEISIISIIVVGKLDEINGLTGKLGLIPNVSIKTAISKKEWVNFPIE